MIKVELSNRQSDLKVDSKRLFEATRAVLEAEGVSRADVSLAVVDDETIHDLNRRFLSHDYATDVLSFLFEQTGDYLEGEIVVSADTAIRSAADYDWPAMHELLLYIVHGTLHLVGYDDHTVEDRQEMRQLEGTHLNALGITVPPNHLKVEQPDRSQPAASSQSALEGVDQ